MNGHQNQQSYYKNARQRFAQYYTALAEKNKAESDVLEIDRKNLFSALSYFHQENAWTDFAQLVHSLDVFLDERGYWDELRNYLEVIWLYQNEVHDSSILLSSLLSLADVYGSQGERERSVDIYQKAIKLAEYQNDGKSLARAFFGIGTVHFSTGEFANARQNWETALEHANQRDDSVQIALIKYNLSLLEKRDEEDSQNIGRINQVTEFAAGIFSTVVDADPAIIPMLRASTALQTGRYKEAKGFFLDALEGFNKKDDKQGHALALYNLGLIAQQEWDYTNALDYYNQSLTIANALKDRTGLILLHSSIGSTYLQMKRYALARPSLEQCVGLLREDNDRSRLADKLYWLGYALANTGDPVLAEQAFEESRMIFLNTDPARTADVDKALTRLREVIRQLEI